MVGYSPRGHKESDTTEQLHFPPVCCRGIYTHLHLIASNTIIQFTHLCVCLPCLPMGSRKSGTYLYVLSFPSLFSLCIVGDGVSQVILVVKNLLANAGERRDTSLIPGLGRSSGGGHGSPLQYSCLENPMDRGAWRVTVHRITQSQDTTEVT